MTDHPRHADLPTLARNLCAGESTIEALVRQGKFPAPYHLGNKRLWKWSEVEATKPRQDDESKGQVYFVGCGEYVKIGFTIYTSQTRLRSLQAMNPYRLTVLCSVPAKKAYERELHKKFQHLNHHGEWSRLEPEIVAFIEELKK